MSVKLIIGADLVPTDTNIDLFNKADIKTLIGDELSAILSGADFTIFNLEVALTDKEIPIDKCGPCLIAPTSSVNGLKAINPHFFTLSNNHILDQGEQGLHSTMKVLKENGIEFAGAGNDLSEASKAFVKNINGINVGIYCCAEHEFSIATENSAGANPFDPLESLDHIAELKKNCDYVVVLYHGGKEHYRYPSPMLQKTCRKIVDKGADLVVCQHSHCIGCEEKWKAGTIVYGQGNFLFDHSNSEFWQTSLLIQVDLKDSQSKPQVTFIPLVKCGEKVRLAKESDATKIINEFNQRGVEILQDGVVVDKYREFATSYKNNYLSAFNGNITKRFVFRVLNKLSKRKLMNVYINRNYKKQNRIVLKNFIECEAHRELVIEALMSESM